MTIFDELKAPFPEEAISWRPAQMTHDKKKAMALAYLDARDVMERLDDVCGPGGWQSEHYDCGNGRMGCKIGILCFAESDAEKQYGQWVWKTDGAGATKVEGDKGAFSDALKRAAVSWGIGRYLYNMPNVWVPIETKADGKFKNFIGSPWNHVTGRKPEKAKDNSDLAAQLKGFTNDMNACEEEDQLIPLIAQATPIIEQCMKEQPSWYIGTPDQKGLKQKIEDHKKRVSK